MKIIRFLDESDQVCYGQEQPDQTVTLLHGRSLQDLKDSGQKAQVKKLLAPVAPAAILCIGLNYHQHAAETGWEIPRYPALFMKNPGALCHPEDPIILPYACIDPAQVDYEGELVVVMGQDAKNVGKDEALNYVAGYTIGNDVSARRWQKKAGAGQWIRGKSFDTFCPLGPRLVTTDEFPDPNDLQLTCSLNREIMQTARTRDMIFPVPELIAYLSESTTLLAGTVIFTGTPAGVGYRRQPPVYLQPGDRVEVAIEGIGTLRNPIVQEY